MPRFKAYDQGLQFLAVDLSLQLHPGSFEYALHHLIEHEIDLSEIETRYKNEDEGALAYDPRVLLKIVLLAYSRGIVTSRACLRHPQRTMRLLANPLRRTIFPEGQTPAASPGEPEASPGRLVGWLSRVLSSSYILQAGRAQDQ